MGVFTAVQLVDTRRTTTGVTMTTHQPTDPTSGESIEGAGQPFELLATRVATRSETEPDVGSALR